MVRSGVSLIDVEHVTSVRTQNVPACAREPRLFAFIAGWKQWQTEYDVINILCVYE